MYLIIDADPNNYMSYYKRATVFLALSRSRPALSDLDKVIQLKSDFQAVSCFIFYCMKSINQTLIYDFYRPESKEAVRY